MGAGMLDGIVVGLKGLDDHFTFLGTSSCAAGDLGYELKCPFWGSKIRKVQGAVAMQHAYQRDLFDMMSFGDPLSFYHLKRLVLSSSMKNMKTPINKSLIPDTTHIPSPIISPKNIMPHSS